MGLADAINRPGEEARLQARHGSLLANRADIEVQIPGAPSAMVEGVRGSIDRRDVFAMAMLGLIGVGIPLWLAAAAGAIGLPTIDDWVYMRGAATLFNTGSIDMPGHFAASVGQLLMVQPFLRMSGGDPWAFTAFGLVMTLIGVLATYLLSRRFVGTGSAAMVVLLVEVFPGFARLSASFMTDVPGYALSVLCLLLGTLWLERGARRALLASVGVGLLAVSIREFAIAAPAAVLVVSWIRSRKADRAMLAWASGIFVAGLTLVVIAATSALGRVTSPAVPSQLINVGPAFVVLAAILLPAVALRSGQWLPTVSPSQIILGAVLACSAAVVPWGAHGANIWMQNGLEGYALLDGTRDPVIPPAAWLWSGQLATFAAIVVATLTVRWAQQNLARVRSLSSVTALLVRVGRNANGLLVVFLIGYAGELVAFAPISIYDRYLFPLVPAAAILILVSSSGLPFRFDRTLAFSHAAFAWLGVSALLIAANSFAYDTARWHQGETTVAMGYDPGTVDAGYEWVGYHAVGPGPSGPNDFHLTWYDNSLLRTPPCVVLTNSRPDGDRWKLISVTKSAYLAYLFFGPPEPLYLYGADSAACPQLRPIVVWRNEHA